MPFVLECFGAFQTEATFWEIFEKFPLVPPLPFFRKCGCGLAGENCHNLAVRALFGAAFCAKIFSSLCTLSAYYLEDNVISARVFLRILSEGYFLGDF